MQASRRLELEETFARGGVPALLRYLNERTKHRFTALYRFDGELLRKLYFFDGENPDHPVAPDDIPVLASYCVFVKRLAAPFATVDAMLDPDLDGHPKQRELRSYCGVPMIGQDGVMFGTLCHFDFAATRFEAEAVELMETVVDVLRPRLRELPR